MKVTLELCTILPVLVVATPVMVMLYVPGAALVVVGVVVPLPPVVLVLDPQPAAVSAATARTAASRVPQRRRRGTVIRIMQARVAPEPTAYQGVLLAGVVLEVSLSMPVAVLALLW